VILLVSKQIRKEIIDSGEKKKKKKEMLVFP